MKTQRLPACLFCVPLMLWNIVLPTGVAGTYLELSSLYDQDAFVTQGDAIGAPLDDAGRWLDVATLPADYLDGVPYPTVDGLIQFRYGLLKDNTLDAVRVMGQTIPVPQGQYGRIHFGWLATDGDTGDLSRLMKLNYTDGTSEELQIGPIADWFNSPAAYADAIHTFVDESTVTYHMNIVPNVDDEEPDGTLKPFVIDISGSALEERPDSRFMDGTSVLHYEVDLPDEVAQATLGIDMWNNFVVSVSDDFGFTFTEVLNSQELFGKDVHNGSNRDYYIVDLTPWLQDNPGKTIDVRFTDGSTSDGWGPQVFLVTAFSGQIVEYQQRQLTAVDATGATVYADFLTDGGEEEKEFLFNHSSQAPTAQGHRFADGNGFMMYRLQLPEGTRNAKAAMNINGNFVVSVGAGGDLQTLVSIVPNVDDEEPDGTSKPFVIEISGSALEDRPDSRFMDGSSVLHYELDLPDEVIQATLGIDMQNNFVVSLADDLGSTFTEVLNSQEMFGRDVHDGSNRSLYTVDLAPWLQDNPSKTIDVRFSDGSALDGWGPQVFKVNVTSGQNPEFAEVISAAGLTQNSLVPYSGSGGQNKDFYTIDLSPFLSAAADQSLLVKLTDATPSDGWGPGIYRMIVYDGELLVRTDGSAFAGLQPHGGLPDNAYPYGANIVRREYPVDSSRILQSITLPTLVENLGTRLYVMAATLVSAEGAQLEIEGKPDGTVTVNWNTSGTLQWAEQATGPWESVPSQTKPFSLRAEGTRFYRVAE